MKPTVLTSSSAGSRPNPSCVRCSDRKVKCDRRNPCGACGKHDVQCVFRPLQPPQKRYKRLKKDIINDRLKRYRVLLQEQGIDPDGLPDIPGTDSSHKPSRLGVAVPENSLQILTPASITSEPGRSIIKTQLLQGQGSSQFVDK